jgi:4-amino-4-deoxy-L-arabinose transferase-like glycosyltransferase
MRSRLRSLFGRLEPAHWIALAAALLLLPQLGRRPLLEPWEPFHAGVTARMAEDGWGNAFGPTADDEFYLERPAAAYWPGALATQLLGPTALAARLPAALAGIVLVWGVFVLVRRARGPRTAALAAAVTATTPLLMLLYRTALPAALAVAASGLAALALLAAATGPDGAAGAGTDGAAAPRRPRWLAWIGWGLVGLAFGLGGLPAALPPLVAVAALLVWSGRATAWRSLRPVSGLLATLAVAAPLCAPALAIHGPAAWRGYLRPDVAEESPATDEQLEPVGKRKPDDRMGFDADLEALAWGAFPWSALAPAALLGLAWRRRRPDEAPPADAAADEAERSGRDFEFGVLAWGVAAWGTTALLGDRFHHDPFGALLPLAVLVGLYLGRKLDGEWSAMDAVLLIAGAGLLYAFHRDFASGPRLSLLTAYFAVDQATILRAPAWLGRTVLLGVGAALGVALVWRRWRWWLAGAAVAAALAWTAGWLHLALPPAF